MFLSKLLSFFSDMSSNGYGGRVSLAATILVYLVVYNETTAQCVLWATFLATAFGLLAGKDLLTTTINPPSLSHSLSLFRSLSSQFSEAPSNALSQSQQQIRFCLALFGHLDGHSGHSLCLCHSGPNSEHVFGCNDQWGGTYHDTR